jgi:hypothetical protein
MCQQQHMFIIGLALPKSEPADGALQKHSSKPKGVTHLQIPSAKCPAKFVAIPPKQVELAAEAPGAAYLPVHPCLLAASPILLISAHGVHFVRLSLHGKRT